LERRSGGNQKRENNERYRQEEEEWDHNNTKNNKSSVHLYLDKGKTMIGGGFVQVTNRAVPRAESTTTPATTVNAGTTSTAAMRRKQKKANRLKVSFAGKEVFVPITETTTGQQLLDQARTMGALQGAAAASEYKLLIGAKIVDMNSPLASQPTITLIQDAVVSVTTNNVGGMIDNT